MWNQTKVNKTISWKNKIKIYINNWSNPSRNFKFL